MGNPKLELEDLTKTYGEEKAIDSISTTIEEGEVRSLLGPSGCGKTTTLRCIAGLTTPDTGKIYLDGDLVADPANDVAVHPRDRHIGMVFQEYAIWPHMTVQENIKFPLEVQNIGTAESQKQRVRETLELVGLEEYQQNLATNLSGGQKQRVAICRAIVTEPEILLMDEPLSNLDAKLRREMRSELKDIVTELGITVLYVTHNQDEAMYLSDKISLMNDGKIVEENDPVSLHTAPETYYGMEFMGQCNVLPGAVTADSNERVTVDVSNKTFELPAERLPESVVGDEYVAVCFRPKFCNIEYQNETETNGQLCLEGVIDNISPTQDFTEYIVETSANEPIKVRDMNPHVNQSGQAVEVTVDPEDIRLYQEQATQHAEATETDFESKSVSKISH